MTNKHQADRLAEQISAKITYNKAENVVGLGCSAGGLAALKSFVSNLPKNTDAAYIVVQHLSPDFDSLMDQILEKHSPLPVVLAEDLQIIEKNTIYLLGARQYLSLGDGRIVLSDISQAKTHFPIDYFFKSLAEEYQNRATGIILSGTGSDGSNGMIELNRMGALCLVQDPHDAEFDGMPKSAIATGDCQHILAADLIGPFIGQHLASHSQQLSETEHQDFPKHMDSILKLVNQTANIDFSEYKMSTVARRVMHRMGVLEITTISDYAEYIQRDNNESDLLVKDMLINVTQFFRDPEVWIYLLENILKPILLEKSETEAVRIWVPGCANGEEAYTLAILFEEAQHSLNIKRDVRIFATDINRHASRTTSDGVFELRAKSEIPEHLLSYFTVTDNHLIISPLVREKVVFTTHNVASDPPFSNMDLISCRNLLIYFQPSAQKRILSYFHFSLRPDGYLVLGSAESIGSLDDYYQVIDGKNRIYQKDPNTRISLAQAGWNSNILDRAKHNFAAATLPKKLIVSTQLQQTLPKIKEKLIERYVPSTMLLDTQLQLVYSFGDTDPFTKKVKPGMSSLHYTAVLHEELTPLVTTALKHYEESHNEVIIRNLTLPEQSLKCNLHLQFVQQNDDINEGFYILTIETIGEISAKESTKERDYQRNSLMGQQIKLLDAALLDATELVTEKQQNIEAMTEELQCSNEELMAANEELQSSNEELQSVNEELFTVNSEFQEKIKELESVNYDLDNLLKSTQLGVIYLDEHLLIRRFTPKARDFVKLLPMDLNRPFSDISLTFAKDKIYEWIRDARTTLNAKTYQLENFKKQKLELTITPYIDRHDIIEGVILVFKFSNLADLQA